MNIYRWDVKNLKSGEITHSLYRELQPPSLDVYGEFAWIKTDVTADLDYNKKLTTRLTSLDVPLTVAAILDHLSGDSAAVTPILASWAKVKQENPITVKPIDSVPVDVAPAKEIKNV